ncbi:MAG: hypothetical protein ACLR7D_13250 [Lachnospira eligens]
MAIHIIGSCKECEAKCDKEYKKKKTEKEFAFSDNLEILVDRQYKEINPKRILDISALNIDVTNYKGQMKYS